METRESTRAALFLLYLLYILYFFNSSISLTPLPSS